MAHAGLGVHGHLPVEAYQLDVWALHAYPYEAELEIQGRRQRIRPGTVGLTPPGVKVVYYYSGPVQHRYAHFRLSANVAPRPALPMLFEDDALYARVWEALGALPAMARQHPLRAEVALWELLWSLSGAGATDAAGAEHPALAAALSIIDGELARPLSLRELARRADVSPNHLIRLFRARFGRTVAVYLRERRVAQARHLLRHTSLTPKAVAANVGLPNLQVFNKTLRRELGAGPRALRARRADAPASGVVH